jgi:hypothetical protein
MEDITYSSKIILTINGTGNQQILSDDYNYNPDYIDKIYVNNVAQANIDNFVYNLTKQINNITIIWNEEIISCYHMFYNLSNITF